MTLTSSAAPGAAAGDRDVKANNDEQFRTMNTQTALTPADDKSGNVIYPYEKAK